MELAVFHDREGNPRDVAALHFRQDVVVELFGMGASWGGYESLCVPVHPEKLRTATPWTEPGPLLRLHVGLETLDDLKADLSAALARYRAA